MANNFGLFFTREGTVVRLPVNPEKLPEERTTDNGSYNVLSLGPIMQARDPNLRVVQISSFFPGRPFSGVLTSGGFQPPEFYINFFSSAMRDKAPILYTPVRYYENGEPFMTGDQGMTVLVTIFSTEERAGETGDFYYDLELTEYKDFSARGVTIGATAGGRTIATTEPNRAVPVGELIVGQLCVANGPWYATSYGEEPHGSGSGRRVVISRIVDKARDYPYHINGENGSPLGWMKASGLQVVSP